MALVGLDVLKEVVVVVLSKQPQNPGVLHVSVDVLVGEDVDELVEDRLGSVPLLLKYFQLKQSTQSGLGVHLGTVSYASTTSRSTMEMRCDVSPCDQPRSLTVS